MRPGVLPVTPKQSDSSERVAEISPRPKKPKFQKVLHQDRVDNCFRLSRRTAQRIRTRGKKSKCRIL